MTGVLGETEVLADALRCAPSVHNTQPWSLTVKAGSAKLWERSDARLPWHDPEGRDRLISCGAAVTNLVVAYRFLGREVELTLLPDAGRPELLAEVRVTGRKPASAVERARYLAIARRASHRARFVGGALPVARLAALAAADGTAGTDIRIVAPGVETAVLARLLNHTAVELRGDRAYQRELGAWMPQFAEALPAESSLPWAGLVRPDTHLPDDAVLAERLAAEGILLVLTADDARGDWLRAGMATESVWLSATVAGAAGSVLTQPLRLPEVRAGMVEQLGLAGYPQMILRLGYP